MRNIRQNKGVFAGTVEDLVLRIGLYTVMLWLVACVAAAWYAPGHCLGMLRAAGYQTLGGRAAGISAGLNAGLPYWLVVAVAFTVDVVVVFLLYPVVVYSYERRARRWFMRGTIESTIDAAQAGRGKISRWGVVGIVFFVWFPFYMTGALVGSVIGYFLGVRAWINLTAVGSGTLLAIISWTFIFDWLLKVLKHVASGLEAYVPLAVVVFVLLGVLAAHVYRRKKRAGAQEEGTPEQPEKTPEPAREDDRSPVREG